MQYDLTMKRLLFFHKQSLDVYPIMSECISRLSLYTSQHARPTLIVCCHESVSSGLGAMHVSLCALKQKCAACVCIHACD